MASRQLLLKNEDFGIAKAEHKDYQAIVDMSDNIYNGFDYLLPIYHKWIDMEVEKPDKMKGFVLVDSKNKVVGYQMIFILEKGKSIFAQALRICPSLKGKGMGKIFDKLCKDYLKTFLQPEVTCNQCQLMCNFTISGHEFEERLRCSLFGFERK